MNMYLEADSSAFISGIDSLFGDLQSKATKILKQSIDECGPEIERRGKEIFKQVVDDFYGSYSPVVYNRNKSMENILELEYSSQGMDISYEPSRMSSTNGTLSGQGLYELVFKEGYHGGAKFGTGHPNPGTPYWRQPIDYYYYWSRPAAKSEPPYDEFDKRFDEYLDGDAYELIATTFDNNFSII